MKKGLLSENGLSLLFTAIGITSNNEDFESSIIENSLASVDFSNYSFETGILGISWFLEFLKLNLIIRTNTNNLLEEIDDLVYKLSLQIMAENDGHNVHEILNLISYHQIRTLSKNKASSRHRKSLHFDCIKLLINSLIKRFLENDIEITPTSIQKRSVIYVKICSLIKYGLNEDYVGKSLYKHIITDFKHIENNSLYFNGFENTTIFLNYKLIFEELGSNILAQKIDIMFPRTQYFKLFDSSFFKTLIFDRKVSLLQGKPLQQRQIDFLFFYLSNFPVL